MTEEKRKRGRPRKIKIDDLDFAEPKTTIDFKPATQESYDSDKLGKGVLDEMGQWATEFKDKGFATTPNKGILTVDADKFKPLPDDWFSLGKVAKLQWLTANRR